MSGLTGYLLADGVTDLSNVFISKTNGVALSGTNIFTGNNTFNNNITLPTSGVAPIDGQLGWTYFGTLGVTTLGASTYKTVVTSPTLSIGTYIFTGSVIFVCTTAGTTNGIGGGFSDTQGQFATSATQLATSTNYTIATITFPINASRNTYNGSCVISVTTPKVYYLIAYYVQGASVALSVAGQASFTRIA
jgi:hypothetical protein